MVHDGDRAAGGILELQGGLQSVHIVGVDDGLHGGAVQSAIGIDSHLAGGIGYLLDTNNDFHFNLCLLSLISRPGGRK